MSLLAFVPLVGFLLSLWLMLVRRQAVSGAGLLVGATAVALLRNVGRDVTALSSGDLITMLIEVAALGGAVLVLIQAVRQRSEAAKKRAVE